MVAFRMCTSCGQRNLMVPAPSSSLRSGLLNRINSGHHSRINKSQDGISSGRRHQSSNGHSTRFNMRRNSQWSRARTCHRRLRRLCSGEARDGVHGAEALFNTPCLLAVRPWHPRGNMNMICWNVRKPSSLALAVARHQPMLIPPQEGG